MRRFQGLLIAAGLAAAPASAAAGPSHHTPSSSPQLFEKYEWSTSKGRLGVMVMSLTPELRTHLGEAADRGVLVARVEPNTPAAAAGIEVGDVIAEIQGHAIDGASDVFGALDGVKRGQTATIQVVRDKKPLTLQVTLADDPAVSRGPKWSKWWDEMMKPFSERLALVRNAISSGREARQDDPVVITT